ncbi:hypothetical protein V1389_03495 [Flavobacterium rakeshii]|uniref:hypothetical protein n=1 Tax=Flavobacterium rakeshii TaxID=1038845 RepID=UPI002E7BCDDE|nr:hypothetical protein [Flavobacterium rakeshii]MEE1897386.1 hypothetical protein [Flavobacterium rakeshii]
MDKNIRIITKLNRETNDGKVEWARYNMKPTSLQNSEEVIGHVYGANVLNRHFMIYKYKSKGYNYDGDPYYITDFRLDLVNHHFVSEWSFPNDNSISDLYETIQYKSSNIENFINEYLDGEDNEEQESTWL